MFLRMWKTRPLAESHANRDFFIQGPSVNIDIYLETKTSRLGGGGGGG